MDPANKKAQPQGGKETHPGPLGEGPQALGSRPEGDGPASPSPLPSDTDVLPPSPSLRKGCALRHSSEFKPSSRLSLETT